MLQAQRPGGINGHATKGLHQRQAFTGRDHLAAGAAPVGSAPGQGQRLGGRHHEVGMERDLHARARHRAAARDLRRPLGPEAAAAVVVGQRMDVVGVDAGMGAQRRQPHGLDLGVEADVVGMDVVVEAWLVLPGGFERIEHGIHAGVVIDMHMHRVAGVPQRQHAGLHHRRGHQPFTVMAVDVAGSVHLHQLR